MVMSLFGGKRSFWGARRESAPVEPLLEKPFHQSPVIQRVEATLAQGQFVALIYLDLVRFRELEKAHGHGVAREILVRIEAALKQDVPRVLPAGSVLAIQNLWGDDFVIYVTMPERPESRWLDDLCQAILATVRERLSQKHPATSQVQFHCAHTLVEGHGTGAASLIYQAIKRAMEVAKGHRGIEAVAALREFEDLLHGPRLNSVYQPIVSLDNARVLGWEALIRAPQDSRFGNPEALFRFAEDMNLTWPLDRTCRQTAVIGLPGLAWNQKLFLNMDPRSVNDPQFIQGETLAMIQAKQIQPQNVVFEITERTSIRDFPTFRRALEHYRSQGYLVAVDDVGAGYSSLQAIAELRPDFIKLDMSLVKTVQNSPVKQAILETFVTFGAKIGCTLIAEGIESSDELHTLIGLGVEYGQGYYLARPAAPPPQVSEPATGDILRLRRGPRLTPAVEISLEHLLESVVTVSPGTRIREVAAVFQAEEAPPAVVVLEGARPVGLLMRDQLFRHLSGPFGAALHDEQPVSSVMDRRPLVVEVSTPIDRVSRLVAHRDLSNRQDYVVVTDRAAYRGVLSVHRLLDVLTQHQLAATRRA